MRPIRSSHQSPNRSQRAMTQLAAEQAASGGPDGRAAPFFGAALAAVAVAAVAVRAGFVMVVAVGGGGVEVFAVAAGGAVGGLGELHV